MNKQISVGLTSLLIAFGFAASGRCQTYFVSTPMSGYCEVYVSAFNGSQNSEEVGILATFGTLNETLYYDPVSNTLQQVGSVAVSPGAVNSQFTEFYYLDNGTILTGQVSVSLTLGAISFGTSVEPANINESFLAPSLAIPITGSYTLDTGGSEYTGPLNYSLGVPAADFTKISSVTSTSLTFSTTGMGGLETGPEMASVTASNGFPLYLDAGAADLSYDGAWSVASVTAEAIPEPCSFLLLLLGASGLMALRVRTRKRISVGLTSLLIAFGFAASGRCQTYFVSTPMSGYVDMDVYYESEDSAGPDWVVGVPVGFGTLNDTLYYDSVADTLQQVGNVTLDSGSLTAQFPVAQYTGLTILTGQVSITESWGTITFDSELPGNGYGSFELGFVLPVTGSYTFDTGGAEYTRTFGYNLDLGIGTITISSVTSTTLTFYGQGSQHGETGPNLGSVTAANGFFLDMQVGSDDTTYDANWDIPSVMAEAIPEPCSFLLLLLGASGLMALRVRTKKRISVGLTSMLIAFGFAASGRCQTYFVSTDSVGGGCQVFVSWVNGDNFAVGFESDAGFGTLNETLYYDPVADTLRQVGSVTMNPGSLSGLFTAYEYLNNVTVLTGQVSVSLTLGTISFDTGVVSATGGGSNFYDYISIPVTGSYTLDTGGEEYTGSLSYSLALSGYAQISSVTSTALTFSQWTLPGVGDGSEVANVTASNGFQLAMFDGANDNTYYYSYQYGPFTAEAIPEPSTLLLVVLAASGLMALRVRRR